MPRARSPNRDKAYRLWLDSRGSRSLKDIARELGVLDTQVRKWKNQDQWEIKQKGALPKSKRNVPKQKRLGGGPIGNQNAKGHGAPKGNKNNFRHGLYEKIYWDTLDDQERQMVLDMNLDEEEALLEEQIKLLTVRERRILLRIEQHKYMTGQEAAQSVVDRRLEIQQVRMQQKQVQTETTTETLSLFERVERLEAELTRIQGRKTRCIESLNKLRIVRQKMQLESSGNAVADDWIYALIGGNKNE